MTKILLVEDDVNLREIFQMRLIAEGYDTVTADNGEDGLVVAMKDKPDLIISDVMMPKLSGFEMLETLRAAPEMANTKAIMMTALGQAEDRARGEKLGVIKYLVKSQVTLEDFVHVVREVIQPGQASDTAAATPAITDQVTQSNKESEGSMPPVDQPTGAAPTQGGDSNPISSGVPSDTAQQSSEQEQSSVQDQINNFVSGDAAAGSTTAADSTSAPADSGSSFGGEPTAAPSSDSSAAPAGGEGAPTADTTAPEPPASTEPPAPAPEPPASTGTL